MSGCLRSHATLQCSMHDCRTKLSKWNQASCHDTHVKPATANAHEHLTGVLHLHSYFHKTLRSFWGPSGDWDWSVDANQRWMLLAARQRGASIFEAFSNTPPYWMTVSGRSSGNVFPWLDNLRPEYYDQFVHYLTEVVRWYRDQHGIIFRRGPSLHPTADRHLC